MQRILRIFGNGPTSTSGKLNCLAPLISLVGVVAIAAVIATGCNTEEAEGLARRLRRVGALWVKAERARAERARAVGGSRTPRPPPLQHPGGMVKQQPAGSSAGH